MRAASLPALLLAALAACTPPAPEPAAPVAEEAVAAQAPGGTEAGRVLALRPLAPPAAARGPVAQQLLVLAAGPEPGGGDLAYEVLVRIERTGRDVALFHPADPALRVGDRVGVTWEPRPRLRRLAGG